MKAITCIFALSLAVVTTTTNVLLPQQIKTTVAHASNAINQSDVDDDSFNYDGRIVGGVPTSILNFPYQVSLQHNGAHICGGAIVHSDVIITAAHCLEEPWNVGGYKVRVGSTQHKYGGKLLSVKRIINHEQYSTTTYNNDIALVQLASVLVYAPQVQAVALAAPADSLPPYTRRLFVSGWGLTSESDALIPSVLNYVAVRMINQDTCARSYRYVIPITKEMFCAGHAGKDSCQGDSGGPLVGYANGVATLYGIVSWGVGCAQQEYPGVYANVAVLRSWIDAKLSELEST